MNDKKKRYVIPEAELVDFANDDIITLSATNANNADWVDDDNTETL